MTSFNIQAKKELQKHFEDRRKLVWIAEKVEYDNMVTMRTFRVEVKEDSYLYTLVKNGTPEYYRAKEILSHYGLERGLVMKDREIMSEDRSVAMSACWRDAERPILKPLTFGYDSTQEILQRLEDYDIIEMGSVPKRTKRV